MTNKKLINLTDRKIMLSSESVSDLISLSKFDAETKSVVMPLMFLDTMSRNNSVYAGADFKESFYSSRYVQEQLKNDCLFGEWRHPDHDCSQTRFMTVEPEFISHKINNVKFISNMIEGKVTFAPPRGDVILSWINSGSNIAMSVRALTPTYVSKTSESGQKYIYKYGKSQLITWDAVFVPGFENARMADPQKYDASIESFINSNKSLFYSPKDIEIFKKHTKEFSRESVLCDNDLKELIKSQEAAVILEDLFEFDMKNAKTVLGNNFVNVQVREGLTLKIPTDTYLINSILGSNNKLKK